MILFVEILFVILVRTGEVQLKINKLIFGIDVGNQCRWACKDESLWLNELALLMIASPVTKESERQAWSDQYFLNKVTFIYFDKFIYL